MRDHLPNYAEAGAVVLGVSPDPVRRVKAFADKQSLDFTLLADEDHAVCEQYGVWAEKSMYGRKYMGALRATFVIGPDGIVRHVIPRVTPENARRRGAGGVGAARGGVGRLHARCPSALAALALSA